MFASMQKLRKRLSETFLCEIVDEDAVLVRYMAHVVNLAVKKSMHEAHDKIFKIRKLVAVFVAQLNTGTFLTLFEKG